MVAPVQGPFTYLPADSPIRYKRYVTSRQKPPFDLVLPFEKIDVYGGVSGNYPTLGCRLFVDPSLLAGEEATRATNQAYAKLLDKLGDRASLGVNLVEYGQATQMIAKRATQLYRFTRKVVRFDIPGAAKELGMKKPPRGAVKHTRGGTKNAGNLWLEYHFGWDPLIKDIFAATERLTTPRTSLGYYGSASQSVDRVYANLHETYVDPNGAGTIIRNLDRFHKGKVRVRTGGFVRVSNPNLNLLTDLGLTNPAVLAWEVIPFSFVVDWFVNVSQVLNSYTDMLGLSWSKPFTSTKFSGKYLEQWSVDDTITSYSDAYAVTGEGSMYNRTTGLATPKLQTTFKVPGVTRAATAISLLLQFLPKK